jgi:hypothetical protein
VTVCDLLSSHERLVTDTSVIKHANVCTNQVISDNESLAHRMESEYGSCISVGDRHPYANNVCLALKEVHSGRIILFFSTALR